jgi:hypothetical protein
MKLIDALDECLTSLQRGEPLEDALARHPELAAKLRPLLEAAVRASRLRGGDASPEVVGRGRARVLGHAVRLRGIRAAGRPRPLALIQRLALASIMLATLLGSGTGLVRASSNAVPGEQLYPIKRTVESVRLFVVTQPPRRLALLGEIELERLEEIDELFGEERQAEISFAGILFDLNGQQYVSGIPVVITPATEIPAGGVISGTAIRAIGWTQPEGYVELTSVQPLAVGEIVPVGRPILLEAAPGALDTSSDDGHDATSTDDMPFHEFRFDGTVDSIDSDAIVVDGRPVYLLDPPVGAAVYVGAHVEVEGYFDSEGRFIATEIEIETEEDRTSKSEGSDGDKRGSDDESDDDDSERHEGEGESESDGTTDTDSGSGYD